MAQEQKQQYTWDDTVAAVGKDFSGGKEHLADETISYNDVVRYCEPWEIGNLLYWDEAAAKQAGYRGVVVPWSAIRQTFSYGGAWRPGDPSRFPTPDLNASARFGAMQPEAEPLPMPPTRQGVVTDIDMEFFEPVVVGDRVTVKGKKLISVRPRQTRIGVGGFYVTQSEYYSQQGDLVARVNFGMYSYNPGEQQNPG